MKERLLLMQVSYKLQTIIRRTGSRSFQSLLPKVTYNFAVYVPAIQGLKDATSALFNHHSIRVDNRGGRR